MTATPVRTRSRARTTVRREPMGTLADGRAVEKVILANANGISATVMTLGASLQSLHLPDRNGVLADVVLGHDTPEEYLARRSYFGASVGRYANRIAHGRFALDGREYRLDTNDGPHHLHGGDTGFDQKLWTIRTVSEGDAAGVELELVSPDGEGGYPGTLRATASYTLDDSNRLCIVYRATTDAPTIVNLTNHALFNLAGEGARGDVLGQRLTVPAARLEDPASGRVIELEVTAPGLQVYSGNFLDGTLVGKRGRVYRQSDGLALEPQCFPDTPNRPEFPSARLDPGMEYVNTMMLRFPQAVR